MSDSKLPSGIDRIVGQRLRWRRRELKLTQEQLSRTLGLTFQQVQKYEKGTNRVSAGRLFELARVLDVPITYFFDGAEDFLQPESRVVHDGDDPANMITLDGDALELIQAFESITDLALRKSLLETIKAAARAAEKTADS
ncbi:MAG: helix-turn-helix transcriptional regulator [Pseudomonadota bacterium]